jgi:MEDS: MEthanogen/methylotroph, DcmR Sensory domain
VRGVAKMGVNPINCHIKDALDHIDQAVYGAHYIIIYPDLDTLRELYSNYACKQIEHNNEIVLINPFYETTDSVRQVLSQYNNHSMNVSKYEEEKMLIISDSLDEYFGDQQHMLFKKNLANYANQMGKSGLSVLADLGAYHHKSMHKDLVDYELSLPTKYDTQMKGFCLYHQKDFDKFSDEQKQKLIEHHGKAIKIMET